MVIGVTPVLADRVRLAELLDGHGPVGLVLVSTIEEARRLLGGGAVSHRNGSADGGSDRVTHLAGLAVDSDRLRANRNGHQVELTPLERDLLLRLGSEPRQTWTHAALHETVWHPPCRRPGRHPPGGQAAAAQAGRAGRAGGHRRDPWDRLRLTDAPAPAPS